MTKHLETKRNRGVSLIEILIVVSIIVAIAAITVPGLAKFHNQQVLRNTTEDVISILNEARNDTISSKNSLTYGVHFETNKITLFTGTSYSVNSSNKIINIDSSAIIPSSGGINLNGGGSDIVFQRITGDTTDYGTIVIRQSGDVSQQKVVSINKIGIIGSN